MNVFRSSLIRSNLVFGCERPLITLLGGVCATIFITMKLICMIASVVLFILAVIFLRKAARYDHQITVKYMRLLKYEPYYGTSYSFWNL